MIRVLLLVSCLALAACEPPPYPAYLTQAADPSARVRSMPVVDATAGTRSYAPAEPGDWEKINRAVTPQGGQK